MAIFGISEDKPTVVRIFSGNKMKAIPGSVATRCQRKPCRVSTLQGCFQEQLSVEGIGGEQEKKEKEQKEEEEEEEEREG
ncbi:hypothetical protein HZH66_011805 [Vespula vulgaris]|uniref:Uncharacterized protein n=1 Tax=Vespula vulgaris TaxID=7454 RepID=A0A834JC87_VESVU|nr:hypothetical protein HZH66_011805 [Vespula vulgaris]